MSGLPAPRRASVRRVAFVTLAAVLVVVAGVFMALAVGIRAATTLSTDQRQHVEALDTSNALERLVVDLETGLRGICSPTTARSWRHTSTPPAPCQASLRD